MIRVKLVTRFRAGGTVRTWTDMVEGGPLVVGEVVEAWDDEGSLRMRVVRVSDIRVVLEDA